TKATARTTAKAMARTTARATATARPTVKPTATARPTARAPRPDTVKANEGDGTFTHAVRTCCGPPGSGSRVPLDGDGRRGRRFDAGPQRPTIERTAGERRTPQQPARRGVDLRHGSCKPAISSRAARLLIAAAPRPDH